MYMTGASLVGLAFGATNAEANPRTVFVENGVPKNIREIGLGWEFETGYIEIYEKKIPAIRGLRDRAQRFSSQSQTYSP